MPFHYKIFSLLFVASFLLWACDKEDTEMMILTVSPIKATYHHPVGGDMPGYEVTNEKRETFVVLNIHGFEDIYEEGYAYKIRVKLVRLKIKGRKPHEDEIDNLQYYLLGVIEKNKVARQ